LGLSLGRSGELKICSGGELHFGSYCGLCRLDEGGNLTAGHIGGDGLEAPGALVQHLVAPRHFENIRDLLEQHVGAARAAERQIGDLRDLAAIIFVQNGDDIEYLISLVRLPHDITLIGRADQIEDLDGVEAPSFEIGLAQSDGELRQSRRRLNLNVGRPWKLAENARNLP